MTVQINLKRLLGDLESLSAIGSTGDGGVHRPALSDAHLQARAWLRGRIEDAGLEFHVDPAGNHFGRLRCGPAGAPALWLGSHLDSVPYGGRFDGALGVVAAMEVLRTVAQAGIRLPYDLCMVDFTDEEGTLVGLLGSRAVSGSLGAEDLEQSRGESGPVRKLLERVGISDPLQAQVAPSTIAGYLEVHIEQGDRLLGAGAQIGIVTGFVGIGSHRLRFQGRADHAGTTPMSARRDAGLGASAYVVQANRWILETHPEAVLNFGRSRFYPGAYNIVPARADLALEFRAPTQNVLDRIELDLLDLAERVAADHALSVSSERLGCIGPAPCDPKVLSALERSCSDLGLTSIRLFSGAGHDAQAMASICPTGMIFIPSTGGSHNPDELASDQDCINGVNVLLQTALNGW